MASTTSCVIVTGAAGGIGAGIVRACAQAGWQVLAVDLQASNYSASDDRADWQSCVQVLGVDLAAPQGPQQILDAIGPEHHITALVNCAGIMRRGNTLEVSEADWDASFSVNVTAAFRLCRAAIPVMATNGGGVIVNIASQWGLHPAAGHVAYNASKAAMVSLTQSIARDHGPEGIRANAVCPGEVLTPMVQQKLEDTGTTETQLAKTIPVGRLGRPQDIADLVVYLLDDRADYINGAALEITGGQVVA